MMLLRFLKYMFTNCFSKSVFLRPPLDLAIYAFFYIFTYVSAYVQLTPCFSSPMGIETSAPRDKRPFIHALEGKACGLRRSCRQELVDNVFLGSKSN